MGNENNSESNPNHQHIEGISQWQKYESDLQKDKPSNIEPYTTREMTYL